MEEVEYVFEVDEAVKVYASGALGMVKERAPRMDEKFKEVEDAYLVEMIDGETDWFFRRQLEPAHLNKSE